MGRTKINYRSFYNSNAAAEHYLGIHWPRWLWAAVLEQAVQDVLCGPGSFEEGDVNFAAAVREAARDWIADDTNEPRRFVWVCEQLGFDPASVRDAIERRRR